MCGLIAAQLGTPWLSAERMRSALATIAHRGPDGSSDWFSADRLTAMGHVRLSIIGLDNGTQPLGHARGDLHAVVNGEFYGFRAIRDGLRERGYRFVTDSDSEIALHLYDEHGLSFVDHLRGEFALVIADRRSGELIAARDRFGIKPLFYALVNGEVMFASEIKALLALGVPARWNGVEVLAEMATIRSHGTQFENVHQVPPGCLAIAKNGQVRIEPYWDNVYPTAEVLRNDRRCEADVITQFRAVLDEAVAERLTADVEVACYLSGGLDSSAVLGLAQAKLDRPIRAFTIAFEGSDYDESPLAERTAAFTGSNYVPIPVTAQDMADALEESVWHGERQIFNLNAAAKFLLSRAVRDAGIKVVFTGEGSDEMLAGYPSERRDNMLHSRAYASEAQRQQAIEAMIAANPVMRHLMFSEAAPAPGVALFEPALGYVPSITRGFSVQYNGLCELLREGVPGCGDIDAPYARFLSGLDIPGRLSGRNVVNQSLYVMQKSMLINFILTVLGDRMEMGHSIEGRVPFLDHHVAEFAAGLPVHYKIRETTEKYILREAARDVITPELYARQKHPFVAPPIQQVTKEKRKDPLLVRCEDIIRSREFSDQPFFEPAKARAYLDSVAKGAETGEAASPKILQMATLSIMHRQFGFSA